MMSAPFLTAVWCALLKLIGLTPRPGDPAGKVVGQELVLTAQQIIAAMEENAVDTARGHAEAVLHLAKEIEASGSAAHGLVTLRERLPYLLGEVAFNVENVALCLLTAPYG